MGRANRSLMVICYCWPIAYAAFDISKSIKLVGSGFFRSWLRGGFWLMVLFIILQSIRRIFVWGGGTCITISLTKILRRCLGFQ